MHRKLLLVFSALAILLLVPSLKSSAMDRIVLKDGNVVEGEIIRTTARDITLKGRYGMITFPLKRVRRVREDGKFWTPPEIPEEEEERESEEEFGFDLGASDLKNRLLRSMREIEANPVGYWTSREREPAPARVEHRYRFLAEGEEAKDANERDFIYGDELPPGPSDKIVWVHEREIPSDAPGGITNRRSLSVDDGPDLYYWVPLYWHTSSRRWLPSHPLESAFHWEQSQVQKMLNRIVDANGRGNSARIDAIMTRLQRSAEQHDGLKARLRRLTRAVAGRWRGDGLLYDIYMKNLRIAYSSDREKPDLVRSRRSQLRQLISIVP